MQIAIRIMERLGMGKSRYDEAFGHRLDTLALTTPDRRPRRGGAAAPRPVLFGARRVAA